jgi:hypothetical protein
MSKTDDLQFMPTPDTGEKGPKSGRVRHDERGNAVWEWSTSTGSFARDVTTQRLRRLEHAGLSIAEDERPRTPTDAKAQVNKSAARSGYDPYQSAIVDKKAKPKKTDLRELSKWIELKKKLADKQD